MANPVNDSYSAASGLVIYGGRTNQQAATSITVSELPYTWYQRYAVGVGSQITVSGTYEGSPSAIEARIVNEGSLTQVTSWSNLITSPTGGVYSALLQTVEGGPYLVEVRDSVNNNVSARTSTSMMVGAIFVEAGQSNMANKPSTVQDYPLGDPNAFERVNVGAARPITPANGYTAGQIRRVGNISSGTYYPPNTPLSVYGANRTFVGMRGDGHVLMANLLTQQLGVPVLILNEAVSGSDVNTWLTGGTNWNQMANAVGAVGGDFEAMIWYQGETNAVNMSGATYETRLGQIHSQCKSLNLRDDTRFKFFVFTLGPGSFNGSQEGDFGKLRVAQLHYALSTPGAYLANNCYDGATSDGVHITGATENRFGRRAGAAFGYAYGAQPTNMNGPYITGAVRSGSTIDVSVGHSGGTSLTDGVGGNGTALTTMRVFDNGVQMTISSTVILNSTTIRLTLSSAPTGVVTMDNAITNVPSGTGTGPISYIPASTVYDDAGYLNSLIGCPLQPKASFTVS